LKLTILARKEKDSDIPKESQEFQNKFLRCDFLKGNSYDLLKVNSRDFPKGNSCEILVQSFFRTRNSCEILVLRFHREILVKFSSLLFARKRKACEFRELSLGESLISRGLL
jgi:hypothetical protein